MIAIFYLLHKIHFSLGQQTPPNKGHKFHPHLHLRVNQEKKTGTMQRTGGRKEGRKEWQRIIDAGAKMSHI